MPVFKTIIYLLVFLLPLYGKAQLNAVYKELRRINFNMPDSATGWSRDGNLNIKLNQALYDNWVGDGNNNIELAVTFNQKFNYQGEKLLWDNYLISDFGLNKTNGQSIRKTQDRLEYNSLVGFKLPHHWSVSFFMNLQTQITNTYDYDNDADRESRVNGFLAPLYATTGPGFIWRKNNKLNFNLAPVTCKITYINGKIHRYENGVFKSDEEIEILGIEPGKKINYELGFYSSAFYEFQITKNIKIENRLSLYSNYLDEPANIDLDYTMRMHLDINHLLSTQITLQTRYDDDAYKGFQTRESVGVGFKFKI